jgi:hypothetical protein
MEHIPNFVANFKCCTKKLGVNKFDTFTPIDKFFKEGSFLQCSVYLCGIPHASTNVCC